MKNWKSLLLIAAALAIGRAAHAGPQFYDMNRTSATFTPPLTIKSTATVGPLIVSTSTTASPAALAVTAAGNVTMNGSLTVTGGASVAASTFTQVTDSGLTSGRITTAGTSGLLQDSASLLWNGTTVTAGGFSTAGNLVVTSTGTIGTLSVTSSATFVDGELFNASINKYRRPNLIVASTNSVFLENNTGTANQTCLLFGDGNLRCVTESTSTADQFRLARTSATAALSGTYDSGMRSGETVAVNTSYMVYGVKATDSSTNYVVVLTTALPIQANYSTINGYFGTNGWVYLGWVRYGDNSGTTAGLLSMSMSAGYVFFTNNCTGSSSALPGYRLANSASSASLSYARTNGTTATDIPTHIKIGTFGFASDASANIFAKDTGSGRNFLGQTASSGIVGVLSLMSLEDGLRIISASAVAKDITLTGYYDPLLSGAGNGF